MTEVVIVLNSDEAVKAFSRGGNVTVGGESCSSLQGSHIDEVVECLLTRIGGVSAAAGPIGTGGQISASLANPAPMFSYSKSKGMSLSSGLSRPSPSRAFIARPSLSTLNFGTRRTRRISGLLLSSYHPHQYPCSPKGPFLNVSRVIRQLMIRSLCRARFGRYHPR